jgi:hypothetical protein
MISKEDALVDLQKVETDARGDVAKLLVGIAQVIIKVLITIRSNQLLTDSDRERIRAEREKRFRENQPQK